MNKVLVAIPDTDPYRNTGKSCLGGGMHFSGVSSFFIHSVLLTQTSLVLMQRQHNTAMHSAILL